jgi:hypothetical protein
MNKAKQIIKQKGITEGQLIDGAGLSSVTAQKIMKADNWPDPKTYSITLRNVARVLGVTVDDLYGDNNKGDPP